MGSLFRSTSNTRALPTGDTRYIRSDYPGQLTDSEVDWLRQNKITTIVDLRERKEYEAKPCRLETEEGFLYYHLPVTGGGDTPESPEAVAAVYLGMIDEQNVTGSLSKDSRRLLTCGSPFAPLAGRAAPALLMAGFGAFLLKKASVNMAKLLQKE